MGRVGSRDRPHTMTSMNGIANLGNTCYLNSTIQALRHATPFASYFGTDEWKRHEHPERKAADLVVETAGLIKALTTEGKQTIVPMKFVQCFIRHAHDLNEEIRPGAQADAAEALQILLDTLHMQQAREVRMDITGVAATDDHREYIRSLESWASFFRKEYSPLVESFYGQTRTSVICGSCKAVSTRYEPWSVLKLSIPGAETAGAPAPSLQECFRSSFASESIDDYACEACKSRSKSEMTHAISRFPSHLIISLKRFTNMGSKVRARIPYDPAMIDIGELRAWPTLQGSSASQYRVYATVEHLGSSYGGHYCMRALDRTTGSWSLYDDSRVNPTGGAGGAAGPDTYILFLELSNRVGK
jgi:ubiquitin C-terminal hydrolase